ncbi:MAG: hypothetical protein ACE5F9_01625 [Phycisphaerae bacterium]
MFTAGDYQVVDVLMLVANVAPVALYFLILGLVNTHARPYLITKRSDFILLTSVLIPILVWPVPFLAAQGYWWSLVMGGGLAAVGFFRLLPSPQAGFVVYNISESRCMRLMTEALRSLGREGRWEGNTWRAFDGNLLVHASPLAILRNVSLHVVTNGPDASFLVDRIGCEFHGRLKSVAQLPSTMGACLVVIGVGLLIVPMWLVGRHINDLVDAMLHLFG